MPFTHGQREALDELRAIETAIADSDVLAVTSVTEDARANIVIDVDLGDLALPRQDGSRRAAEQVRL